MTEPKSKCNINMFNIKTTISDDIWNKIKDGQTTIELIDKDDEHKIGYISYRKYVGQIGLLFITDENYMRRSLGTQLLNIAIADMKTVGTKEVWAVTSDNHYYWSNIMNFKPRSPAHSTVTGSGYAMKIEYD
jgi:GNAT superfamily N-acetyltransferase